MNKDHILLIEAPEHAGHAHHALAVRLDGKLELASCPLGPNVIDTVAAQEPLVVMIGSIPQPIPLARRIYQLLPAVHILFLANVQQQEHLRREMRYAPMIGTHWNICAPEEPSLSRLITEGARSTRQRRQLRTRITHINQQLTAHPPVSSEELNKLIISDRFLASILTNATDAILSTDLKGRVLTWNRAAERLFGYSEQEMLRKPLAILNADTQENTIAGFLRQTASSQADIRSELVCVCKSGNTIDVDMTLTPVRDEYGRPFGISVIARDVTERNLSEQKLRDAQKHLSLMVESAQDYAIISVGVDGRIISWSPGAQKIFGFTPEEAIGEKADILFTPEDQATGVPRHEREKTAYEGKSIDERWHIRKNGERFYASGVMAAMVGDSGQVKGFIKIARDMTEQKRAEEDLIAARNAAEAANIAKTEFLANMSHEIRTPMNAVIGLSNILAISQPLTQKQKDFIKTLQMSADSLLALINDLLDIAKIESRTVELEHVPFSVSQVIHEVISMMAVRVKEKNLNLTSEGECVQTRMFMGDPTRLRQIILNLCSNAIKFTESGGVHVSITCQPTDKAGTENICIAVHDTGIGIAPEKLETIFHKFVQADTSINRKYGGTGLGLAITKTLAEIMRGTITVESKLGEGSVFHVCVPLELAEYNEIANADYSLESIAQTMATHSMKPRILLVEDYAPNVLVATTFLEQFNYVVEVANNGLEAFRMVKNNTYTLALMDVQMHGMNGFEATQLIRKHEKENGLPHLPIIGMTAHALAGDRERCLAVGMDDYISKPFNPDVLQGKIAAIVESNITHAAAANG